MSVERTEMVQPEDIPTPSYTESFGALSLAKDMLLAPARQVLQVVRSHQHGSTEMVHRYHMASRKALAMVAIAATAGAGGCGFTGGGSKSIGGEYLYISPDGATVDSMNLVRDGSHLTGSVEILAAITSDQANQSPGVLDATGKPVPGSPVNHQVMDPQTNEVIALSDNAACGGTPMCFQDVTGSVDGRLGANNRISLSIVTNLSPTPITDVGELQGNGFVLNGGQFMPSNSKDIAAARNKAPTFLRTVTMPAYTVHQEISALQKPAFDVLTGKTWDGQLAEDVSTLQSDANIDPVNQLGCDYSGIVTYDINNMQADVTAENAEIAKAQKLIGSLTPAVRQQAGGDIAKVEGEITKRQNDISQKVNQANAVISQANTEEPKIETLLQRAECGVIHLASHALLEAGD